MNTPQKSLATVKISSIPVYSEDSFSAARERILLHRQSPLKFQAKLSSAVGATLPGDYSTGRISHNYFSNCTFDHASLKRAAGTGSIFRNTDFLKTDLSHATFQSSTFETCSFEECDLSGCNMSGCYFQDTVWKECAHGVSNMSSAQLNGCTFLGTKPGNLADAVLEDVRLEDVRLANMNLEFSEFKKISTKNVVLPFSQLPYIFGGLQYLMETSDNIRVSSHINAADSISPDEYIAVLKDMEIFYSYQHEYFPLASILLAFQRYEEAVATILCGIGEAALQRDFRMCKYYCKLITNIGCFPKEILTRLYQAICQAAPVQALTGAQYYQYLKYIHEIRSMLIENPNQYPHATLRLETGICEKNISQTALLLSTLDQLLHLNGIPLVQPSVSISHNSPEIFIVNLCGSPISILVAAALILSTVSMVCKAYNDIAKAILNTQEIAKNHRSAKREDLEVQKLSAEIAKLKAENPELQCTLASKRKEITENGIIIVRADLEGEDFDPRKWL